MFRVRRAPARAPFSAAASLTAHLTATCIATFVAFLITAPSAFAAALTFQPIPGSAIAMALSADGSTVVGYRWNGSANEAFRWSLAGGMQGLGDLPGGSFDSMARAVSADGSVVVGRGQGASASQAFRWTAGTGMVALAAGAGYSSSAAFGVSHDGSVVVGSRATSSGNNDKAFRWTAATGMVGPATNPGVTAFGVSADGNLIVGEPHFSPGRAFRWDYPTDNMTFLEPPSLPGQTGAYAISADGSTIVGAMNLSGGNSRAFRWTAAEGVVDLGSGIASGNALAVSGDGSVIVGTDGFSPGTARIWTASTGLVDLKEYLLAIGVAGLDGWQLQIARGVSDDGLTIAGYGINPQGLGQSYLVTIPEPSTGLLAAVAVSVISLVTLARRRRRKGDE